MQQFAEIPAGTVHLNDARRNESRTAELRSFRIGVSPVTLADYSPGASAAEATLPATGVRWIDAVKWCIAASEAEGTLPAYEVQGDEVSWHLTSDGYRLPTEAEWVHACRAGSSGARYGEYRLLKGGGWADPEWSCRVGVRRGDSPIAQLEDAGFRVVRGVAGPAGQGWSEAADRAGAAITGPRPVGWTPLR